MTNQNAETAGAGRITDQVASPVQPSSPGAFDALQLYKEGAAQRTEANITPAVYHPGETNTLIAQGGPRVEEVQYGGHRIYGNGRGHEYGPNYGAALAGSLLYDTMVDPYDYYPVAPVAPLTCLPSRYYGAPPVCYSAPILPYYGPGGIYGPEFRYEAPRGYEHGGGFAPGRGHR